MNFKHLTCTFATATILITGYSTSANAAAIISNGTIQLGVDNFGQLNIPGGTPSSGYGTSYVGLRFLPTGAEATAPGCLCEGWGVADPATGVTGYANNAIGTDGITGVSFTSTPSEATVIVKVGNTFQVTHKYTPVAETPYLYQDLVTVENIGNTAVENLLFRRVMDWDIEPTAFREYITIGGTANVQNVIYASDNGFASSNPLSTSDRYSLASGALVDLMDSASYDRRLVSESVGNLMDSASYDRRLVSGKVGDLMDSSLYDRRLVSGAAVGDFIDLGPYDHGALFDFDFGLLDVGKSFTFTTFYGAAPNEKAAMVALGDVAAEVYSLGQPNTPFGKTKGEPNTFIFAFSGVGGQPVEKVPEPSSILALLAFGVLRTCSVLKRKLPKNVLNPRSVD